ncbi:MAG: extracellular solute-binding protein [Alphaproteobacteria bacterium]|nr:extracellular solute-binding protein [Alphaproteobacteria bacterium]
MDRSTLDARCRLQKLDRRALNAILAPLGLALATIPMLPRPSRSAPELTYFTWAGYELPELHPGYVAKHGSSPNITFFADEEEALLKLRAGFAADIAHPCNTSVGRWFDAGVIKPMDPGRLEYWNDLIPALRDLPGSAVDGKPLFIANDWGSHSVAYRTDRVDPERANELGWNLLLDETLRGQIGMWDALEAAIAFAAIVLGIKDTTNVTDEQIKEMKSVLVRQKELLRTYWVSETDAETMMASGELAASYLWSAPVFRLREQGVPVEYMLNPPGGIISWVCGLVMTTTGQGDEQAAYDFINAWTSPEAGKYLVEVYGYGHANRLTYDVVAPDILKAMGLSGDISEYLAQSTPFRSWDSALVERYAGMFEDVKTGV